MCRPTWLLLLFLLAACGFAQQTSKPLSEKTSSYSAIPRDPDQQVNPVKATPESLAHAKKWWTLDYDMCHGKSGDGNGETARDMKLNMPDFIDPATLKNLIYGELPHMIQKGYNDVPAGGPRIKTVANWGLVNYIRSLAKTNGDSAPSK